jgi:hypothetical protein
MSDLIRTFAILETVDDRPQFVRYLDDRFEPARAEINKLIAARERYKPRGETLDAINASADPVEAYRAYMRPRVPALRRLSDEVRKLANQITSY